MDESDGIASTSGSFEEVTLEEEVINEDLDFTFEITSDASSEGTQSVKMNFADYSTIGAEDYLLADKLLTSVNKYFEFSFDYAYARYDDQYFDKLAIVIKNSCGEWFEVWSRSGADLATAEDHESPFVPEVGEWKSESFIISIPANYSNTEIAFKAVNGFGNNLYIDNYAITPITPSFSIESIDVTNAICPSESNGEIELSVSGSGSYTYQLDNSLFQSSSVFENLSPGNYTVSVKDDSETIIRSFASVGPDPIEYELDISNPSCNGDLGMVQFSLEGGTGNLKSISMMKDSLISLSIRSWKVVIIHSQYRILMAVPWKEHLRLKLSIVHLQSQELRSLVAFYPLRWLLTSHLYSGFLMANQWRVLPDLHLLTLNLACIR